MAIAVTLLTNNVSTTDASSWTSASVSPAANSMVLAIFASALVTGGPPNVPTAGGTLAVTWTDITAQYGLTVTTGNARRLTVFAAQVRDTALSGTVSASYGGQTQESGAWAILQVTGHNTTGVLAAIPQAAANNGTVNIATGLTVTLNPFQVPKGAMVMAAYQARNSTATPDAAATELSDQGTTASVIALETQYQLSENLTVDVFPAVDVTVMLGVALEITPAVTTVSGTSTALTELTGII